MNGVCFSDENNGTAVGWKGTIIRTTNGGTNWTSQSSGTLEWLLGVSFTDANNGWAVGDHGVILRTTNGGTSWTSQTSGTSNGLSGVSFTDINNGTVVGGPSLELQMEELPGFHNRAELRIICLASHLPIQITVGLWVVMEQFSTQQTVV